jgi:hypothetical protein
MDTETPIEATIRLLQDLKTHAEGIGLVGRVVQTGQTDPPVLMVINPYSGSLSEEIGCKERAEGEWWLYWSWGDPICRAGDFEHATRAMQRVVGDRR